MDAVVIDNSISKGQWLRTPSHAVAGAKKKSFEEACAECNAVSLETFADELKKRVKRHYHWVFAYEIFDDGIIVRDMSNAALLTE